MALSKVERQHLQRLRQQTIERLNMGDVAKWVASNTTVGGRPYSYLDHEYQERIMSDESQEVVVRKCSQVGLSEMSIRMALGLVSLMESYSLIYTFPSASFAATYVKTRVNPVISGSPFLSAAVGSGDDVDSSEVKQVGQNFAYFKGAAVSNAAISVSADHLIHDELDFSDETVISQYHSRLTHSPYKRKTKLSTPTVPGGPIDQAFKDSRRWWNFCRCSHCSHLFIPSYYDHVVIPGYKGDLREITKQNLHKIRHTEAMLLCPKCGREPSLQVAHREWVCENPTERHMAVGYQVQPFDCPNLISLAQLIEASVAYKRRADFDNFSLGLPAEDAESGLMIEDLDRVAVQLEGTPFHTHVIGCDMGMFCRMMIGGVTDDGKLVVVHAERIPIAIFRKRYKELCEQYRVTIKVLDMQPYVETILSLQELDQNLYGAFFVTKKGLELYEVKSRDEDREEAVQSLRQVGIARNKLLDAVLDDIREGAVAIRKTEEWPWIVSEMTDMKRAKAEMTDGELISTWVKSKSKNDHYHMAFVYLWVAARMRGVAQGSVPVEVLGVSKFKQTAQA